MSAGLTGFNRVHKRLSKDPARGHQCTLVACDQPAAQWAHRPCDLEQVSTQGPYCDHPNSESCYAPACAAHHRRHDLWWAAYQQLDNCQLALANHPMGDLFGRIIGGQPVREALAALFGSDVAAAVMPSVLRYPSTRRPPRKAQ